jgi:hypothetical protein
MWLWCESTTPFGVPVEPEVKITQPSSPGAGGPARPAPHRSRVMPSRSVITAHASTSRQISRARASGSDSSTGTYAAPASSVPSTAT